VLRSGRRDFVQRTNGAFADVRHVGLSWDQVLGHNLPPALGKSTDPRAAAFAEKHGRLVQVELEALRPETLRALHQDAIADYWDEDAYRAVLERESREREELTRDAS
jgi:hypothetical protein